MKGSDAKKGKHRKWLAGAAFSAALVGTCLLLFLLSDAGGVLLAALGVRSEERRVGKECRSRWSPYH